MPIQITEDRFGRIRSHLHRKVKKTPRKHLSRQEIYQRKKISRLARADGIEDNQSVLEFFQWIWQIQKDLKLTNRQFAERIGVSLQTLKLWRNSHGHYPSDKSYRMLLKLYRESTIIKEEFRVVIGERISAELVN